VFSFHIHPFSECSLLLQFSDQPLNAAHDEVQQCYQYARQHWSHLVTDMIPAYNSLLFSCKNEKYLRRLQDNLVNLEKNIANKSVSPCSETRIIPVCFDYSLGNDLEKMAAFHKLGIEKIIEIYLQQTYKVYMLGFLPGFAYMGEVDERIALPRKDSPMATRKGAVGIAGRQTGIYPLDSPGGWHILGYTTINMFDINRSEPTLLKPGDLVRFEEINLEKFREFIPYVSIIG
jgi:inhibitor of KinA